MSFNQAIGYAISAVEWFNPTMQEYHARVGGHLDEVMGGFASDGKAKAADISEMVLQAMQPIKHLFVASLLTTCGCYLASKYTPLFSSVFKVLTVVSGIFTFDMYQVYALTYREYLYFDARKDDGSKEVKWKVFINHIEHYCNGILASTFLISHKWFLWEDISGGVVEYLDKRKDASLDDSFEGIRGILPGLGSILGNIIPWGQAE